jgi:serine/threonine protein phosphatase PrpC
MEKKVIRLPTLQKKMTLINEITSQKKVLPRRASTLMTVLPKIEKKVSLLLPSLEKKQFEDIFSTQVSKRPHGKVQVFVGCTSAGRRDVNEDRVVIFKKISKVSGKNISYFAIFDGFSGTFVASYLRDNLHKEIFKHPDFEENTAKAIQEGFFKVQSDLLSQYKSKVQKTGACALVCLIVGKFIYIANLGNCRCFLSSLKGFEKDLVTEDHLTRNVEENERILRENGEIVEFQEVLRVKPAMLNVTRCFGCEIAEGSGVIAIPDIKVSKITKKMDFLLLASDGIWSVLSKQEIINSLWTSLDKLRGSLEDRVSWSVKELMKKALVEGSSDNLSVILIGFPNFNLLL